MKIFKKYWFWIIFVIGIVLIISKFTYHSDLVNVAVNSARIANGDLSLKVETAERGLTYSSFFPPVFHLIDGLLYFPFQKLGIYKFDLMNEITTDQLVLVSFLLKLRYLVLFILALFLVGGLVKSHIKDFKDINKIFLLWLLCPVLIFVPFAWGNNDIYPMFFSLLFLLFAFKKKNIWAMIFLGLSMAMKNYAVFLVLPAAVILANKNVKKTIIYCLVSAVVYLIPYMIFYEVAHTFVTGGGEGLFILQRNILNGPLLFPLFYFLIVFFLFFKQDVNDDNKNEVLTKYCFLILSLFYLASFFIPHWFLWIMPFFVLTVYKDRRLFYLYCLILFCFFISLFSWSRNIDMNLFSVSFPMINKIIPLGDFISTYFPDFKFFSIIYSLFFAAFLAYIYILFFEKKKNDLIEKEIKYFSLLPLFIYLLICFVYVVGMNYLRNRKDVDWYDLGLISRNELVGKIDDSNIYYQTFKSPKNNLKGINVFFATYGNGKKVATPYSLKLYEADCKTKILETPISVEKITDYEYREVLFNELKDSEGKEYCFTVEPSVEEVETPLSLVYSKSNSYSDGNLLIDGVLEKDDDAVFQLIYPVKE